MKHTPEMNTSTDVASNDNCNEEISLLDLLRILVDEKQAILVTFLIFVALGILYALLKPEVYRYTTTIEIGTIMEDGRAILIDRPETVLAKIQEAYIPYVLEQSGMEDGKGYQISARIPQGSEVVVLDSEVPEDRESTVVKLHKGVVELVKQNHQRVFEIIKKEMEVELDKSKNKLSALQDRHRALTADLKRLDRTANLLNDQIEELKALVDDAIRYRRLARSQTGDETQAMTLLMIDNEIQQNNQRLAALEERLYIDIPREKDSLNNAISDNSREQQEQAAEIAKIQATVNNMRETRMLISPMRSPKPVGPGKLVIVLVSIILGLFGGIFIAFIRAFIRRAKEELQSQEAL